MNILHAACSFELSCFGKVAVEVGDQNLAVKNAVRCSSSGRGKY